MWQQSRIDDDCAMARVRAQQTMADDEAMPNANEAHVPAASAAVRAISSTSVIAPLPTVRV